MSQKVILDSSVCIEAIRADRWSLLEARTLEGARVYLSAVVGSELLRGAHEPAAFRRLRKTWANFSKAGRLIIPTANDWQEAGLLLRRLAQAYDYEAVGLTRLVHDALLAMSARRLGITVVTLNLRDFARLAEFRKFVFRLPAAN